MTPGRAVRPLLLLALPASVLTGCGLLDGGSRLEESFEYLPADTTAVEFTDQAAIDERLGVDVGADPSEEELAEYLEAGREAPAASRLHPYLAPMTEEAAFSGLDVEWEAHGTGGDAAVTVWKVRDDLDLDAVGDDLVDAGYEESGTDDERVFTAEADDAEDSGLIGDRYPAFMLTVAVVPDEHLVLAVPAIDAMETIGDVLVAVTDEGNSLADSGGFEDVVEQAEDPEALEHAQLGRDDAACAGPGGSLPPEQAAQLGDLGRPSVTGVFFSGEEHPVRAALLFDSEADAEADAEAREAHLREHADLYRLAMEPEVSADGSVVVVETDAEHQREVQQMVQQGGGLLACAPSEAE